MRKYGKIIARVREREKKRRERYAKAAFKIILDRAFAPTPKVHWFKQSWLDVLTRIKKSA